MYGTVARLRVRPGMKDQLMALSKEFEDSNAPGWIAEFIYQTDEDPNVYYMAVVFESRRAYAENADSPEMDAFYQKFRALLEEDPEWHDGEIVWAKWSATK